jgi:hypothetical protein
MMRSSVGSSVSSNPTWCASVHHCPHVALRITVIGGSVVVVVVVVVDVVDVVDVVGAGAWLAVVLGNSSAVATMQVSAIFASGGTVILSTALACRG